MSDMELLAADGVELEGTLLVEASAGTGKTWTIGALVLRFLLEEGRTLPELLVLTFTDAATAELRDRLRARLEETRRRLELSPDADPGDSLLDPLRARLEREGRWSPPQALARIRQALASFDEASIFTIHGFCRRVLAERPLALGLPPRLEAGENAAASLQEVARDELRRLRERLDPGFLDWLGGLRTGSSLLDPEAWIELARLADRHPDAEIPPPPVASLEACDTAIARLTSTQRAALETARRLWNNAALVEMEEAVAQSDLTRVSYRLDKVAGELAAIRSWLERGAPVSACDTAAKYTPSRFAQPRSVRKGGQAPAHPGFAALDRLVEEDTALAAAYGDLLTLLQVMALRDWPQAARRLRLEQRRLDFGDLLTRVQGALAGPGGAELAAQLRQRWRVALVDEYQDTDPVQADIFRRIFAEARLPLVLVGDPKQSIYGFRGADLHAYLAAARRADRRLSLGVNWRSDPGLVRSVNLLFEAGRFPPGLGPFLHQEIRSFEVEAHRPVAERRLLLDGRALADLIVLQAAGPETDKGRALRQVCAGLARLVARLLRPAPGECTGWAGVADAPARVQGREIAVLVRTHTQGEAVAAALAEVGVACAQVSDASVWDSAEARELVRLLGALARPHDTGAVRALLAGTFALALGLPPREALLSTAALERLQLALHAAAAQARQGGLAGALERLMEELGLPEALLGLRHGERRLVNWRHLLDLLRLEEATGRVEAAEMALRAQLRRGSEIKAENAVLRLESEENLVRVITQHRCKGLEFPLVFCPFLWTTTGQERKFGAQLLHDAEGRARLRPFGPQVPLDESEDSGRLDEQLAEELRLAYVSLTRARNHTIVHSLMVKPRSFKRPTALHWLLLAQAVREGTAPGQRDAWKDLLKEGNRRLGEAWLALATRAGGAIDLWEPETVAAAARRESAAEELPAGQILARVFSGNITAGQRISSFTSLMTGAHGDERLDEWFGRETSSAEDAALPAVGEALADEAATPMGEDWRARFPRGTRAGLCLHGLLEQLDFRETTPAALLAPCRAALLEHGLDVELALGTAAWLLELLDAPLENGAFRLRDLAPHQRAAELEFHLAVAGLEGARLEALLRRHRLLDPERLEVAGPELKDLLERSLRQAGRGLPPGWLKGYIDLCHVHEGRWWIVDWKSNRLCPRAAAYTRPVLLAEMARSGYFLQALLYLTALHRHLGRTLPGYAPERHLGGLRYFFLRGIDRLVPGCGVFEDRPPVKLIIELDELLGGGA